MIKMKEMFPSNSKTHNLQTDTNKLNAMSVYLKCRNIENYIL